MNTESNSDARDQYSLIPEILKQNPGFGFTVIYFGVSLIGLLFSWALFSRFDVNIFHFTEISDFLLAALREPMTFVMTAGAIIVAWGLLWFARFEARFFESRPPKTRLVRGYAGFSGRVNRHPLTIAFVFVAYSYLFIGLYGQWKADSIKRGEGQRIVVQLSEPPTQNRSKTVVEGILLGSTNRFLFLYNPDTGITSAMPAENIVQVMIRDQRSSHE